MKRSTKRQPNRAHTGFSIESLETRRLLSAAFLTHGGSLIVAGNRRGDNTITVGLNADTTKVDVTINGGATQEFDASEVKRVRVAGGRANDTITIDESTNPFPFATRILGRGGDDTLSGGSANDTINGGGGADDLSGEGGNDVLRGGAGDDSIDGDEGNDRCLGDAGIDLIDGGGGDNIVRQGTLPRHIFPPTPPEVPAGTDVGSVSGTVKDGSGDPVGGAIVLLHALPGEQTSELPEGATFGAITDENGAFDLAGVPVGDYVLVAGKRRVGTANENITVTKDQTTDASVTLARVAPPPPTTGDGTVTGTITDADGNAIVDADVRLLLKPDGAGGPSDGAHLFPLPLLPRPLHAETDDQGHFTLTDVPEGNYIVGAFKLGVGGGHTELTVTKDQTSDVTVAIEPHEEPPPPPPVSGDVGTVDGVVKDKDGNLLADADVSLFPAHDESDEQPADISEATQNTPPPPPPALHAHTDDQGRFDLTNVPIGSYTIVAHKLGAGLAHADVTVTKDQTSTINLTLQPPTLSPPPSQVADHGTVHVHVVDKDGHAVEGAHVVLTHDQNAPPTRQTMALPPPPPHGETGADGSLVLDSIPVGSWNVSAGKFGVGFAHETVTVNKDQTVDVTLTLDPLLTPPPPMH
jgi:hypothetical protein